MIHYFLLFFFNVHNKKGKEDLWCSLTISTFSLLLGSESLGLSYGVAFSMNELAFLRST